MVDTLERGTQTQGYSDSVNKDPVHLSAQISQAAFAWNKGSTDFSSLSNVDPKTFIKSMENVRNLADQAIRQFEQSSNR